MSLSASSFPPVEETLHGVRVHDPYRWLEDRSLPETARWIEEQQVRSQAYFASCETLKQLRCRVQEFLNVEVVDQPAKTGGRYFYRRRCRNQEQACIYVREAATGAERLLVDPSGTGQFTSVGIHRISFDGSLLAYEVKQGGEDSKEIRIVDVGSGRILPDCVGRGYARGFTFATDLGGFYYCQETSSSGAPSHLIQFHSFSGLAADRVVFDSARAPGSRLVLIADDIHLGARLMYRNGREQVCDFFVASREQDKVWRSVFVNKKLPYSPILDSGRIFALSHEGALNGQIVELTVDGQEIRTVVPETEAAPRQIAIAGGRFLIGYLENGRSRIRCWTAEGEEASEINIPAGGTIQLLPQPGSTEKSVFYTHESFVQPPQIYEYSAGTGESTLFSRRLPSQEQNSAEVRTLVFVGEDGTAIPVTLVARNGIARSGPQPVIMTSYGGFGVPMTPQFSVLVTIMIELGATFAIPHIRGGGEFGKPWHDAGRARNRQTSIDDFIGAAKWLCAEEITTPAKLAIFGGSNSGLLVGAAMTQRPDLFCAVVCIAPLLDMVRYERFDQAVKWQSEYGSVEFAEEFHALYGYSPYHRVRMNVDYPATLFVSGDRDDRCNPAHVRKMAARLQERAAQSNPILVDYSEERGHSPVLPLSVRVDALARRLAFLSRELGIEIPGGGPS